MVLTTFFDKYQRLLNFFLYFARVQVTVSLCSRDCLIENLSDKQSRHKMESESEIASTFSTLNVNAVEFIPSFSTAKESDIPMEGVNQASAETPENNGNGKPMQ